MRGPLKFARNDLKGHTTLISNNIFGLKFATNSFSLDPFSSNYCFKESSISICQEVEGVISLKLRIHAI